MIIRLNVFSRNNYYSADNSFARIKWETTICRKKNQFLVYFIEIQESSMTIIQRRMRTFNKFEKVEE